MRECREGTLRLSHAIEHVDVDEDLLVDTAGHPMATGVRHGGLGSAVGTSGSSCLPSLARVPVHVHDHVHVDVHDHVAACAPDSFTGFQA
ncbi:MAG: hypothetical protein MUF10_11425 [Thermoanaerobaculaceae bacterium]|nr:hypothetical protein [Thermoanaerobaculaceae bacterium]